MMWESLMRHNAGIVTFGQLADANAEQLKAILKAAGIEMATPDTWLQQAKLAANEEWDKLDALQDEMKGGRK